MSEPTLREYLENRVNSEKALAEEWQRGHDREHAFIARNLAEYKAASNEWRGALSDMRSTFASNVELDALREKVDELRRMEAGQSGRSGGSTDYRQSLITLIALGIAGASLLLSALPAQ